MDFLVKKNAQPLRTLLYQELSLNPYLTVSLGISTFVLLTALGAYVWIPLPFTPVPITLQTFFVLLSGAILGSKYGTLTQSIYLILGLLNVPLFAGGSAGIARIFGPTGGYLVGFIFAAYGCGLIHKFKKVTWYNSGLVFLLGTVIILFCGTLWLGFYLRSSIADAFYKGTFPFIVNDMLKLVVLVIINNFFGTTFRRIFFPPNKLT